MTDERAHTARAACALDETLAGGAQDEALLPCPFCGGQAETNIPPMRNRVRCVTCGVVSNSITAWNRRPARPSQDVAGDEKVALTDAARDVLSERRRQISVEGWDDINDDCHDRSEMAQAAACYALSGTPADEAVFIHGKWEDPRDLFWPLRWSREWWKPTDRRRDLVKAGALILAEIERLDRAALSAMDTPKGGGDE